MTDSAPLDQGVTTPSARAAQTTDLVRTPYYSDEAVTLYHGDSRDVLAALGPKSVDCIITDPPYTERTHGMAKTNKGKGHGVKAVEFDAFTDDTLMAALAECGRVTRRWVVASLDYAHAFQFDQNPPTGLRALRVGVWVKPNPMPQISADRPGQGWEAILFLHRDDVKPTWHGGGKAGVWTHPVVQNNGHPTSKPLPMVADWVRLFTNPGDTILDPFAGSGTTLRAAKDEGRKAIGVELDERYCEVIATAPRSGHALRRCRMTTESPCEVYFDTDCVSEGDIAPCPRCACKPPVSPATERPGGAA